MIIALTVWATTNWLLHAGQKLFHKIAAFSAPRKLSLHKKVRLPFFFPGTKSWKVALHRHCEDRQRSSLDRRHETHTKRHHIPRFTCKCQTMSMESLCDRVLWGKQAKLYFWRGEKPLAQDVTKKLELSLERSWNSVQKT